MIRASPRCADRRPPASMLLPALLLSTALVLAALVACAAGPVPHRSEVATSSYRVMLAIDRPVVGLSAAAVDLRSRHGRQLDVEEVRLSPVMPDMGHSVEPVRARPTDLPSQYHVPDAPLFSMPGVWDIDVDITSRSGTETARFRVLVS